MPLPPDSPFDIKLTSGRESKAYGLTLDKGSNSLVISAAAQDDSVYVRNVGKRVGDFDEQRNWKMGRGTEKLSDNADGYWDSNGAWTLTEGHVTNGLLWRFAKGLRTAQDNFVNSKKWRSLYNTASNVFSAKFTAETSADYSELSLWLRWRGDPNASSNLTVTICNDDTTGGGHKPGAAIGYGDVNITPGNLGYESKLIRITLEEFPATTPVTLTAGTIYWVSIQTNAASYWEIAIDKNTAGWFTAGASSAATTDSPLFRITVADVNRRFFMFNFDHSLYMVDNKDDGTTASQLYINGDKGQATGGTTTTLVDGNFGCRTAAWTANVLAGAKIRFYQNSKWHYATIASHTGDTYTFSTACDVAPASGNKYIIYSTPYWTELATTGLGVVQSKPVAFGVNVYFPQGSTAMRVMATDFTATQNHKYRSEASNTASFLTKVGSSLWRSILENVSSAPAVAYGTDLTFGTAIAGGDTAYLTTGLNSKDGVLYVFKENGKGTVTSGAFTMLDSGEGHVPDPANGQASAYLDKYMYHSWLQSVIRVFDTDNSDIGESLPDGREGNIVDMDGYINLLFAAVDAREGTSSVQVWDGLSWHEFLRGYSAGLRVRAVKAQANPTARTMIWTQVGDDLVYQEMPLKKSRPLLDTGILYQHESIIDSATIDMGAASNLPKFIKSITVTANNLRGTGSTNNLEIWLFYQTDDLCGTDTWIKGGFLQESPESTLVLNLSNIRRFRYRMIMITDNASAPVDVEGVIPNGYARTPLKQMWTLRIKAGGIYQASSQQSAGSTKLWKWLMDNARFPYAVRMDSKYEEADGYMVIIHPPRSFPYKPPRPGVQGESYLSLTLEEV